MGQQLAEISKEDRPALAALGLCRSFAGQAAVQQLSFQVGEGELYGLVGPDGAGKTTAIRLLTGLLPPDRGEAQVCGQRVQDGSLAVREAIGYMPQQYSLYGDLSIDENLKFFGRLFGISRRQLAERTARLLEITRLARFRTRRADALSGGMYKKLALACALLHRPRVLVLDEPTNGVDPVSRRELWDLLHELVAEGMAVLLATPYMDEAARCHRVGLLHQGALLAEGDPAELVRGFAHATLLVHAARRDAAEELLFRRPEVLALSPQGAALRVVVRQGQTEPFLRWAGEQAGPPLGLRHAPVAPDFEDVFLGRLAERGR
ncbi:MAG: ABC transporter ATP-binding protein [Deltaproteobacteria bacterium]|nr:ABC transporter ATP-binding protein [Deltaproteobacteria bacterium]